MYQDIWICCTVLFLKIRSICVPKIHILHFLSPIRLSAAGFYSCFPAKCSPWMNNYKRAVLVSAGWQSGVGRRALSPVCEPQAGWRRRPASPSCRRLGTVSAGRLSPGPAAATPWTPCGCGAASAGCRTEPPESALAGRRGTKKMSSAKYTLESAESLLQLAVIRRVTGKCFATFSHTSHILFYQGCSRGVTHLDSLWTDFTLLFAENKLPPFSGWHKSVKYKVTVGLALVEVVYHTLPEFILSFK